MRSFNEPYRPGRVLWDIETALKGRDRRRGIGVCRPLPLDGRSERTRAGPGYFRCADPRRDCRPPTSPAAFWHARIKALAGPARMTFSRCPPAPRWSITPASPDGPSRRRTRRPCGSVASRRQTSALDIPNAAGWREFRFPRDPVGRARRPPASKPRACRDVSTERGERRHLLRAWIVGEDGSRGDAATSMVALALAADSRSAAAARQETAAKTAKASASNRKGKSVPDGWPVPDDILATADRSREVTRCCSISVPWNHDGRS